MKPGLPRLLTIDDIDALPDLDFLIESILPCGSIGILYGEPGCGKTFVALSMAMSIATGIPWLGRRTRKGAVLYIAAEGMFGFKYRLRAYKRLHEVEGADVRFLPEGIQLGDDESLKALLDQLAEEEFKPDLVIFDTLARMTVGSEENSAREMGEVVKAADELRRNLHATVLLIHHTRKDGTSERGSSALRGAADVMIELKKWADAERIVVARCAKMKDAEEFADIHIGLEKVDLDGGHSSLVAVHAAQNGATSPSGEQKHVEKLAEILDRDFPEGASHGRLELAFREQTGSSESTFDRALREALKAIPARIRKDGKGKGTRYFGVGV
jgi:RecA/RadA recombinase